MQLNKSNMKKIVLLMVIAVLLIAAVLNYSFFKDALAAILSIFTPLLVGCVIAFVLNIPMRLFENKLFAKMNGKRSSKWRRPLSLIITLILFFAIIALVLLIVIPSLTQTVTNFAENLPGYLRETLDWFQSITDNDSFIGRWLDRLDLRFSTSEIDWSGMAEKLFDFLKGSAGGVLTTAFNFVGTLFSTVFNIFICFVFAIYLLLSKDKVGRQLKKMIVAYLPARPSRRCLYITSLISKNFSSFISGQCADAAIFGIVFFIVTSIFGIPYAPLVSVITAISLLIPIIGPFIGCVISCVLILLTDPISVLWFVIIYLVLQQIDDHLVYPKIIGTSIGLPPIWVLAAVVTGSAAMGVVGILIFVPMTSVIYTLLGRSVNARLRLSRAKKNQSRDKE